MDYIEHFIKFMRDRQVRGKYRLILDLLKLTFMGLSFVRRKGCIRLAGYQIHFGDFKLLRDLFIQIFFLRQYYFDSDQPVRVIIDAGANIGMATVFFKNQYPEAKIISFEPDPVNFSLLEKNIQTNRLENVILNNCALHDYDGMTKIYCRTDIEGGDIGASVIQGYRFYFHTRSNIGGKEVYCERLSRYLDEEVDLLKIDVEGNESRMFSEIGDKIKNVKNIIMEYHGIPSCNPLSSILALLEKNNHRYHIAGRKAEKIPETYELTIRSKRTINNIS